MGQRDYDGEMLDIGQPKWVNVEVDRERMVLYVHVDGITRLRISGILDDIHITGYEESVPKPLTVEDAKKLPFGTILYSGLHANADNTPQRWRVNGAAKTWKTRPECVHIPVKNGLRNYGYITQDFLHEFYLNEDHAKLALRAAAFHEARTHLPKKGM